MMRILLATDGSTAARAAATVVASTAWPAGSAIRIVSVVPPELVAFASEWTTGLVDDTATRYEAARREELLSAARSAMAERGEVGVALLEGRPASAIVNEARAWEADLVVVGSRGHGPWQTMILGSVSAEVVDHAPCPVLVVRGESLEPIIFATDGSDDARRAEALLERWPHSAAAQVTVVTAAQASAPLENGVPIGLTDEVMASWQRDVDEARRECRDIAESSAQRLRHAGYDATGRAVAGDPGPVIVEAARAKGAGLVVIGTRGHGGVTRILLGSVARNVLLHAPCSVLVVRPTARRVRAEARATVRVPALAAS